MGRGTGTGPGLTPQLMEGNRPEQGKGRGFRPSSAASPLCTGSLEPVSPAGKQWRQPSWVVARMRWALQCSLWGWQVVDLSRCVPHDGPSGWHGRGQAV